MAKNKNKPLPQPQQVRSSVVFEYCPKFEETRRKYPNASEKLADFLRSKKENKLQPYGSKDYPFNPKAPLGDAVPGLKHAHITQDLSVFYTIGGSNPSVIKLYGIFSHQDSGTGNAPNVRVQQTLGKSLKGQRFAPLS